ncbi:MAG: VPLPA-CTERM sorting domain-containing protein [Pseudomonadota bacterium]
MKKYHTIKVMLALILGFGTSSSVMASIETPLPLSVFQFSGSVNSFSAPPGFEDQAPVALGQTFSGVVAFDDWATVASTPGEVVYDLTNPAIDIFLTTSLLEDIEAVDIPLADPTSGMTLGTGTVTVVNGIVTTVQYTAGRDIMSSYDFIFENAGFETLRIEEVSFWAGGFNYVGELTDTELVELVFGVPDQDFGLPDLDFWALDGPKAHGSVVLTTVPVPAAVWLFGTALVGLTGIAKRKRS